MAAMAWEHEDVRSNIGRSGSILGLNPFIVHTHVVGRDVEETSARGEGRGLLVLATHGAGADLFGVSPLLGPFCGILNRTPGFLVDAFRPVHIDKRFSDEQRAIGPVEGIAKTIPIEMD